MSAAATTSIAAPAAVATATAAARGPAATAIAAARSSAKVAAAPRSTVAVASILPMCAAPMSAATAGTKKVCGRRAGTIEGVGLLMFNEEQGGSNFQERGERILILQKLDMTADVVGEAL
ncbi:unnamed protein product [Cuscuta campestris]|uniref:Uncharacterized protein n=1 Tax=Cuscuta campestris TaxID=132261 RepID=A0A484MSM4_9ASTE|nr:unnamed protein product [Cuscuta campestris]